MAKILWISWKDIKNPEKGGAERVTHEIRKRLVNAGHQVTLLTSSFPSAKKDEIIEGVRTYRTIHSKFFLLIAIIVRYLFHERGKHDYIIEEVSTSPFFINFFKSKEKIFLFYHQLTEEVWEYELPSLFGKLGRYILEPGALFLQRLKRPNILAMSQSTKNGLKRHGFSEDVITTLPEATNSPIEFIPLENKNKTFSMLYFGSLRSMKRPEEALYIFEQVHKRNPQTELWISGSGTPKRIAFLKTLAQKLGIDQVTKWYFSPTDDERNDLLKKAHIVCMLSVKEGWGTVITEAGKYGTPGFAYDVDGLREAVNFGKSGILSKDLNREDAAEQICKLATNQEEYKKLQVEAFSFNKELTFENTFNAFCKATGISA